MVDGERLGVIFANTDAIEKYRGELLQSITIAGIDGTFKTVPKNPTDLKKGCLLTFHIVFRNVVSWVFCKWISIVNALLLHLALIFLKEITVIPPSCVYI